MEKGTSTSQPNIKLTAQAVLKKMYVITPSLVFPADPGMALKIKRTLHNMVKHPTITELI